MLIFRLNKEERPRKLIAERASKGIENKQRTDMLSLKRAGNGKPPQQDGGNVLIPGKSLPCFLRKPIQSYRCRSKSVVSNYLFRVFFLCSDNDRRKTTLGILPCLFLEVSVQCGISA